MGMYQITYIKINDYNAPQYYETVSAASYTEAYLKIYLNTDYIIIDIKKI